MFPFHPKLPTMGKRLAEQLKEQISNLHLSHQSLNNSSSDSDHKDFYKAYQLSRGGPVQLAIFKDLMILKNCFRLDWDKCMLESNSASAVHLNQLHLPLGQSFSVYKESFQKVGFGRIHSPDICPPRCDRESFIQMIYATVFEFLWDMEEEEEKDNMGDHSEMVTQQDTVPSTFQPAVAVLPFNVLFAVFTLYTLYQTNPLPSMPCKDATPKEALSTLTLGLISDTVKYKMYRRTYKVPIRISEEIYAFLQQERQKAVICINQCHQDRHSIMMTEHHNNDNSIHSVWKCQCITARDYIHVLERLHQYRSFQFCEYTGPCSLDGLAGSKEYYHGVVLKEPISKRRSLHSDTDTENDDYENRYVVNHEILLNESNDLLTRYDNLLLSLANQLNQNYVDPNPSRILKEVRVKLDPVMSRRRSRQTLVDDRHESIKLNSGGSANVGQEQIILNGEEQQRQIESADNVHGDGTSASTSNPSTFEYPHHFSDGLKFGIEAALLAIKRETKTDEYIVPRLDDIGSLYDRSRQNQAMISNKDYDDWFLEGLYGDINEEEVSSIVSEEDMSESSIDTVLENRGLRHLQALLNSVKSNEIQTPFSSQKSTNRRKSEIRKRRAVDQAADLSDDNESSALDSIRTTGLATHMIQSLFDAIQYDDDLLNDSHSDKEEEGDMTVNEQIKDVSEIKDISTKRKSRTSLKRQRSSRTRTSKHEATKKRTDRNHFVNDKKHSYSSSSDDESLKTNGAGAKALSALLSRAT